MNGKKTITSSAAADFVKQDPHLQALRRLRYQYHPKWWRDLDFATPGIYILTGGRQVGKSTSCKLLMAECLEQGRFALEHMVYLTCDEIYDAPLLSARLRLLLQTLAASRFLLIIDEITYVPHWDRVIKALADEGLLANGVLILTGSDTLILKEAAMRFPGRRGVAAETDFHLHPLTFREYVHLVDPLMATDSPVLEQHFEAYLQCGGYLRAINDWAVHGAVQPATLQTYEQWIRGDFFKQRKQERLLLSVVRALLINGVSQVSYSTLTQNIGEISKETCIQYCDLLERMDVLFALQAYDQNKRMGFPKKARKFHFRDPFIRHTLEQWLLRERVLTTTAPQSMLVEATVASHCARLGGAFYHKGVGEVDVILLRGKQPEAFEVKWSETLRPNDFKTLSGFAQPLILTRQPARGIYQGIPTVPVWEFLYAL